MEQIRIGDETRFVIATRNNINSLWSGRLYVNGGETATLMTAKRKTEAGVRAWANRVL